MVWVSIYASDDELLTCNNQSKTIQQVLSMPNGQQREAFLATSLVKACENPTDILLHDTRGRFLWCRLEMSEETHVEVDHLVVSTPLQSLVKYLPEIYQDPKNNGFLDGFLSVFQTIYEDFEAKIDRSSALLDPMHAPDALVLEIADWLGVDDKLAWSTKKLRKLLVNLASIYKTRGTTQSLCKLIQTFCGADAYFVEGFHAMRYYSRRPTLKRLYGEDRFALWIFVFQALSDRQVRALRHLIQQHKPVFVNAKLVILNPYVVLDQYTFLGINTVLSQRPTAALDAKTMLGYATLQAAKNMVDYYIL